MDASLNIVELIENNPITKFSRDYNIKLVSKIKSSFTDFEQQLFLSSFYCYLNYHQTNDFVIDLDDVWKWLGFSQKARATELMKKNYVIENDYINLLSLERKQSPGTRGGHNKETFMMNIKTFKSLCLKAGTKKADEIHDYYMKMEEMIQEVISEECNELKLQLEQKEQQIEVKERQLEEQIQQTEKEKEELKERTLIEQFPLNTQCIYIGKIDNKTLGKPNSKMYRETVIKFGQSNNLAERVKCHKKTYENFRLYAAYKVKNKIEIENLIKKHPILEKRLRLITTQDGLTHREILAINDDEFSIANIEEYIKEIIKQNEYNLENYNLLLKKTSDQEIELNQLKQELESKNKQISDLTLKLNNYTGEGDISIKSTSKIASNYTLCKYGHFLYAFQYEESRFICSIARQKDFETLSKTLMDQYPNGEMKCNHIVLYPFSEKNMMFLLKQYCVTLGANKFEAVFEDIQKILNIAVKLESVMVENSKDLDKLWSILNETGTCALSEEAINPEVPTIRKAKRSIDQINKDTGEVIAVHESIEAAGRFLGLTTGTAIGIALREKRVCKGFLWRYSGFSKEEQFNDQPIIKVCCSTGEKKCFKTIADAARDVKISAPALRNRVLTDVHINNHHWIFAPISDAKQN
jgi:hypothetical protein